MCSVRTNKQDLASNHLFNKTTIKYNKHNNNKGKNKRKNCICNSYQVNNNIAQNVYREGNRAFVGVLNVREENLQDCTCQTNLFFTTTKARCKLLMIN